MVTMSFIGSPVTATFEEYFIQVDRRKPRRNSKFLELNRLGDERTLG